MSIFTSLFRSRDKPQNRTVGNNYSFFMGGTTSGACIAITEEAVKDNMLLLTPSGSQLECTQYDNCFRVCFEDSAQGLYAANFIKDNAVAEKVKASFSDVQILEAEAKTEIAFVTPLMNEKEARAKIVEKLDELGALVNTEDYTHNVAKCERCKNTIEPKVSEQWFVSMKDLAKRAADSVRNGEARFVPQRYEKQYFHWLDNIQDWCISRQLWWGHQIPAYYCQECGEVVVAKIVADSPDPIRLGGIGNKLADDLEKYGNIDVMTVIPKKLKDELDGNGGNLLKVKVSELALYCIIISL